jgi:hypothetical protein
MLRRSITSSVACEHKIGRWWTPESLAILPLSRHDMTPSPSTHCLTMTWLPHHPLTAIAVGWVPTGRLPMSKLLRYPLVACCIAVLSLRLPTKTPWEKNSVGRHSFRRWTLAYIALSHFSNDRHSCRQRYPSLSLERPRKLWWSSTLDCSISFLHRIIPVAVPLTGIAGAIVSEASQVANH